MDILLKWGRTPYKITRFNTSHVNRKTKKALILYLLEPLGMMFTCIIQMES